MHASVKGPSRLVRRGRAAQTHASHALGGLALAAPRVLTVVDGAPILIRQHYFEAPVAQPARAQRTADLTGLRIWPCALPLLAHLQADVLPAIRERVGARPSVESSSSAPARARSASRWRLASATASC